uniref:Uncharacterized protein n=1 Tax=Anguilla anguilla TaxID=7936 RepID=A0A0E9V3F9_ANGAN
MYCAALFFYTDQMFLFLVIV